MTMASSPIAHVLGKPAFSMNTVGCRQGQGRGARAKMLVLKTTGPQRLQKVPLERACQGTSKSDLPLRSPISLRRTEPVLGSSRAKVQRRMEAGEEQALQAADMEAAEAVAMALRATDGVRMVSFYGRDKSHLNARRTIRARCW